MKKETELATFVRKIALDYFDDIIHVDIPEIIKIINDKIKHNKLTRFNRLFYSVKNTFSRRLNSTQTKVNGNNNKKNPPHVPTHSTTIYNAVQIAKNSASTNRSNGSKVTLRQRRRENRARRGLNNNTNDYKKRMEELTKEYSYFKNSLPKLIDDINESIDEKEKEYADTFLSIYHETLNKIESKYNELVKVKPMQNVISKVLSEDIESYKTTEAELKQKYVNTFGVSL
jgi:hypothetical protein